MPKRGRPSFAALAAAEAASAAAASAEAVSVPTPSKKLKGSGAAQTAAKAVASAQLAEQVQDDVSNFNLIQQTHDALKVINGHVMFTNMIEQLPLAHDEGGPQVPLSQASLSEALSGDGEGRVYLCGGNYFWQNFTWMVNHTSLQSASSATDALSSTAAILPTDVYSWFRCWWGMFVSWCCEAGSRPHRWW